MGIACVLIKGSDPVLVSDGFTSAVTAIIGDDDHNEVMDTFAGDDYELADALIAATSVSMFGDRVVVMRNAGRFAARDLDPLLAYLGDPNPTTTLVVVWERGLAAGSKANPCPKKLVDAITAVGGSVVDTEVGGTAKRREEWVRQQLDTSPVRFGAPALRAIVEHVGEEPSLVKGLLRVLEGVFPAGTKVEPADLEPFLGTPGTVAPWDLTDAIDRGDLHASVVAVQRMMGGGERHPLQVMASLIAHYEKMLALDGAGVRDERDAAVLLGMSGKSTYPAKKALAQARRLGSERVLQATELLGEADRELHGTTGLAPEIVIEVLVARLARLSR